MAPQQSSTNAIRNAGPASETAPVATLTDPKTMFRENGLGLPAGRGEFVHIAEVLSVEPPFATITFISCADGPSSNTLTIACSMKCSWLQASTKTVAKGLAIFFSAGGTEILVGTRAAIFGSRSARIIGLNSLQDECGASAFTCLRGHRVQARRSKAAPAAASRNPPPAIFRHSSHACSRQRCALKKSR